MCRMLWLAQSRWIFEFQRLWIGPEYTSYVLHHRVLNLYVLIPVIFILRSHIASFRQFTGNVTTSHTGKLPERIYRYFWKGPVHTWSLYGNLLVIFRKSLYVWKGLMWMNDWLLLSMKWSKLILALHRSCMKWHLDVAFIHLDCIYNCINNVMRLMF